MEPSRGKVTWEAISRASGLTIVFVVVVLRSTKRLEWTDAEPLLVIASGLLGLLAKFGNGRK